MSNQVDFSQIIQKALLTQGPERATAEQELVQMQNTDYKNYLIEAVKVIVNQQYPGDLRQAAGVLIKATAAKHNNPQEKLNWDLVDQNIQDHAKDALLRTLLDQDPKARQGAADTISTICSIELPRNRWTEIIQSMAQNSSNQDLNIRKTAIMTLGFVCDKLKGNQVEGKTFQLQDVVLENILMGIINGMKNDQTDASIKITSLTALRNSLGYLEQFLEKKEVRDFVCKLILDCCMNQDDEIKKESLQTLIEFCRFQYSHLQEYISDIFNITSNHLQSKTEEICIPAIEIWNTLATEYKDRDEQNKQIKINDKQVFNQNYFKDIKELLIQYLLQNLLVPSDNDDENESPIQTSSEQALNEIVEILGDTIFDTFTTFISNTASHNEWVYKQASCIAFGCFLECKNDEKMKQMVYSAFNVFVNMLKEQNLHVVQSAAKFIAKCCDLHPNIILNHPNLSTDLGTIVTTLQFSPEISRHICWAICFLSEALKQNPQSILSVSIWQVIQELTKNALRQDLNSTKDLSLIDCSYMGIMNLLHNSPQSSVAAEYLKHAIGHFKQSYNEPLPKRENIQSGILATMHASLLSIQEDIGNNQNAEAQQMIKSIYELIVSHFTHKKDVDSDGLYVISAIATCIKGNFVQYLEGVWQYLNYALSKDIDGDLFKTAIGALADIARACDKAFVPHLNVLQTLMKCVQLPEFSRELKLHVYVCIGDIILSCKESCVTYLKELQETFQLGFAATVYLFQTGEQSEIDYAEQLQEKVVEAYTCMVHGVNDVESNEDLIQGFPSLIQFLQFTCDTKYNPTIDYVRSALTLITDIGNFYGNKVSQLIKTPFTIQLSQILQKFSHQPENQEILQYSEKVFKSLN